MSAELPSSSSINSPFAKEIQKPTPSKLDPIVRRGFNAKDLQDIPAEYHETLALKLIEDGQASQVLGAIDKFRATSLNRVVAAAIEFGGIADVGIRLYRLAGLNSNVLHALLEHGEKNDVALNIGHFRGLNEDDAERLLEEEIRAETILTYPEIFLPKSRVAVLEKILPTDPIDCLNALDRFLPDEEAFQAFLDRNQEEIKKSPEMDRPDMRRLLNDLLTNKRYTGLRRMLELTDADVSIKQAKELESNLPVLEKKRPRRLGA